MRTLRMAASWALWLIAVGLGSLAIAVLRVAGPFYDLAGELWEEQ